MSPASASIPNAPPPAGDAQLRLHGFIQRLLAGYRRAHGGDTTDLALPAPAAAQLDSLILCEAALRHEGQRATAPRPPQLAVLGPTQTGKSTVVNLLLGCPAAEISPLAGFTVHPQGFWAGPPDQPDAWTAVLLPGWSRCAPAELDRQELAAYSLTPVDCTRVASPPPPATLFDAPPPRAAVVWDTPDFDSLAAHQYKRGILEIAALADAYLLVLSKEKYSDLSVWRMLAVLAPLGRPLVICLNKLTPDAQEPICAALRSRLVERVPGWAAASITTLPYSAALATGAGPPPLSAVSELRAHVAAALSAGPPDHRPGLAALLARDWDAWLAPVRAEHEALAAWSALVDSASREFMEAYERDYLDHPERYDSFRRAAIALLELLELPHVGGAIARARQIVTWPARQLLAAGRSLLQRPRAAESTLHSLGAEAGVLVDTLDGLLTTLQREVARRAAGARPGRQVWQALAAALENDEPRLRTAFSQAIITHHEHVTQEVRATANRLYADLQRSPARLAALRTARATIDAGYLLLAVKTGGLTPLDAVWAPATFALTSLIMESITGFEMSRAAAGLKARQRAAVEQQFVHRTLVPELVALGAHLADAGLFQITPAELATAEHARAQWEDGHA